MSLTNQALARVGEVSGSVDVLVNSAGVIPPTTMDLEVGCDHAHGPVRPALPRHRIQRPRAATALNDFAGQQTVTEGTDASDFLATLPADGATGTYVNRHEVVPW